MWPNFVSEKWNKYYLYSEFTADAKEQFCLYLNGVVSS